jgi:hypothetical protein
MGPEIVLGLELEEHPPDVNERHRVVVVCVNAPTVAGQLLTRLNALTEPSPVARSYPVPAGNEGVEAVGMPASTTPIPDVPVLLHSNEPAAQGTELLPFVTSLNVQPGTGLLEELHARLAVCCAANRGYNT